MLAPNLTRLKYPPKCLCSYSLTRATCTLSCPGDLLRRNQIYVCAAVALLIAGLGIATTGLDGEMTVLCSMERVMVGYVQTAGVRYESVIMLNCIVQSQVCFEARQLLLTPMQAGLIHGVAGCCSDLLAA